MSTKNNNKFIIDEKFYNSKYVASRSDINSMLSIQKAELYSVVYNDFEDANNFRNYILSHEYNNWTKEQENNWVELHKRYIITRKLLAESGYIVTFPKESSVTLRTGININSLSLDDLNALYTQASDAFWYSSKYDTIQSETWNDEYQSEYNFIRMTYESLLNELAIRNK